MVEWPLRVAVQDQTEALPEEPNEEIVDVGQTIKRMNSGCNRSPCILPRSNLWMRRHFRMVEAPEALRFQGVPTLDMELLGRFSSCEIFDLVGNAFCGTNVTALLLAALFGASV
jgi:hypothetical protein